MAVTTKVATTVTNAATKTYSYSGIELLSTDLATLNEQLTVYLTPAATGVTNELTLTTDFTFAALPTKEITLVNAAATDLAVGDVITIARTTKQDELYTDFTGLSNLRSKDINDNSNQLLFIIQENITSTDESLQKNIALTAWDGEGLPSENCAPATSATGWVTVAQMNAAIAGAEIGTLQDGYRQAHSGNNSTTVFTCPTFPKTDISADKIFVIVDGLLQVPTTDYTYALNGSNVPTVTFTTAPPTGTNNIQIRTIRGAVQTILDDDSIDGDAIVDGSILPAKLEFSSGSANRILLVDAAGAVSTPVLSASQMSNFNTTVRANRLDQMAAPSNSVSMNNQFLTDVPTPTSNSHAANKAYVDATQTNPGVDNFMEPTPPATTNSINSSTHTVSGLTAGTWYVVINCTGAFGNQTFTVNGVTRWTTTTGSGSHLDAFAIVEVDGTGEIDITMNGNAKIHSVTGFRIN